MNPLLNRTGCTEALVALAGLSLLAPTFAQGSTRTSPREENEADVRAAVPLRPGRLCLTSHDVDIVINNGFATTTIVQTLENSSADAIEATWAFPLPDEASLSELTLWIDGQPQIGEVVEKAEAERIYGEEKKAGESSATLEQNGFVNYRITLSPVPAQGDVKVRVVYYQPLDIDQGVGRYLYPLQNGHTEDPGSGTDMDTGFWSMDKEVTGEMSLDVTLKTAFPVDGLHSPSHPAMSSKQEAPDLWACSWTGKGAVLDRDFVLFYRLSPDVPARIELLTSRYADQGEGTFMAVVTPGEDLEEITYGTDWMFVLDISGSMKGDKLRVLGRGVSDAIGRLRAEDRFQVILFDDGHRALSNDWLVPGTAESEEVERQVRVLHSAGGTNIFAALDAAYGRLDADRPSAIVLVSDGVANAGPHEYRDFIEMAKTHDARLFTFVMGNSANTVLLGDLSSMSGGFAKTVSVQDEVGAHLLMARDRMSHEAMHGVRFQLEGATVTHPKRLPSLYLGQQLAIFGRYRKSGPSTLSVSARISGEERTWTVPIELPEIDESNPELERLYAMAAIQDLERAEWLDGQPERETRRGTIDMALAYSLVTDHTSMIVVKESRKAAYGLGSSNRDRRVRERDAAAVRSTAGNQVQMQTGGQPLAGPRAAHAPQRSQRRGNGGGGAVGPLEVLALFGLLLATGWRQRPRDAA